MEFSTITPVVNGSSMVSARMQTETAPIEKTVQSPSNQEATQEATQKEIPEEKLKDAVQVANDFLKNVDLQFKFSVDEKTQKEVVEVYDQATGEKLKQFPPEDILKMLENMYDMLGILVDDRV